MKDVTDVGQQVDNRKLPVEWNCPKEATNSLGRDCCWSQNVCLFPQLFTMPSAAPKKNCAMNLKKNAKIPQPSAALQLKLFFRIIR